MKRRILASLSPPVENREALAHSRRLGAFQDPAAPAEPDDILGNRVLGVAKVVVQLLAVINFSVLTNFGPRDMLTGAESPYTHLPLLITRRKDS